MEHAEKQFDNVVRKLQGTEINHLRIEKVGSYFCVRIGKFEGYTDARKYLQRLQSSFHDAALLEAYIKDERVKRLFPDSVAVTNNDMETKEEPQPVSVQYAHPDVERIEEEDRPEPGIKETDTQSNGKGKTDNVPMAIKEEDDRLSLSVQDADIKSVLKALSIKRKLNIVASQDIVGKVSVNLHDLPLKDVLDAVLTHNGFSYVQKDNIMYVTKAKAGSGENLPQAEVMIFKLNYVDIDEVDKVITKLVSESAKVTVYKPEKTLIIEDLPKNLAQVKKVLESLDVPPKQVLIETKIMEVRLNDDTSLGIDWSTSYRDFINSAGDAISKGFAGRAATGTQGFFFNVVNGKEFNLFLEALQTITGVNTLSSPRLLALDNKEAKIIIGGKLGYKVTTTNDGVSLETIEFLETGTQLVLTPHIIDDGKVIMDIHPEVSDGEIGSTGVPSETTTEVTTSVMAPDGGTIFIGGLIRDRKEDIRKRIPGFGAIPILGALFGKTTSITVRTEIIVLITPHIISSDNKEILEKDTQKVIETGENLKKERSLKELLPGT